MEWPEILGKECCVPRVMERIEAEEECPASIGAVAEAFVAFSLANGMDGRVEEADGTLRVDVEDASQKGLQYLVSCTPKAAWWAASSALAEGRSVTIFCAESGLEKDSV